MSADAKGAEAERRIALSLESVEDFEFRVRFAEVPYGGLTIDEPLPVGQSKGPDPSRLLAAAVGGCLSASLLFAARKLRLNVQGMHTDVKVEHRRNERGRLRIGKIEVQIAPAIHEPDQTQLKRCLELFEDFCVVTQSVRSGIEVSVNVRT